MFRLIIIIIINASTDLIEFLPQMNCCPYSIIIVVNCFCHLSSYTRGDAFTLSCEDTLFPASNGHRCAYCANSENPAHCYWVKKIMRLLIGFGVMVINQHLL